MSEVEGTDLDQYPLISFYLFKVSIFCETKWSNMEYFHGVSTTFVWNNEYYYVTSVYC